MSLQYPDGSPMMLCKHCGWSVLLATMRDIYPNLQSWYPSAWNTRCWRHDVVGFAPCPGGDTFAEPEFV